MCGTGQVSIHFDADDPKTKVVHLRLGTGVVHKIAICRNPEDLDADTYESASDRRAAGSTA